MEKKISEDWVQKLPSKLSKIILRALLLSIAAMRRGVGLQPERARQGAHYKGHSMGRTKGHIWGSGAFPH